MAVVEIAGRWLTPYCRRDSRPPQVSSGLDSPFYMMIVRNTLLRIETDVLLKQIDDIEIIHTAHNREGFAGGAVLAAEFIQNKRGIFSMTDVLGF